jgi:hypothetical protein
MKWVLIGGIAILLVFLVVLSFIPLGIEPLTEVYFENHTSLPSTISLYKTYNYSFTIHDLEYQQMGYNYTVNAYDENDTLLYQMDSGNVVLDDNQTTTIFENFSVREYFGRMKIQVDVKKDDLGIVPDFKKKLWWPDPNYPKEIDIHFWVDQAK